MTAKRTSSAAMTNARRLVWWREARFGMFIHWGLYAIPAGVWKGQKYDGIGEWIMNRARIPVPEYEKLAKKFNPVKFNADEWAKLARDAGMKYIVITSKHHDGFAMYDSPSSAYDIVDATPYGKDPIKDLARACRKCGLKLCFYYSQAQDWHDPDAAGNRWAYPDEEKKDFTKYLRDKVKPQLRELLTQYGPVGLIWFDTPAKITREQSLDLKRFVHRLQPACLVSGRVGHGVGDYGSMGDNQIPAGSLEGDWETPATLNDTWGYKKHDHNWKSVDRLLYLLADLASKGVNYLLNVGPTAQGVIPRPSVDRLREIGKWMKVNGQAIYGTKQSPYPYEFDWGRMTQKNEKLYLLIYDWRRKLTIPGLRNNVKKAYLLADRRKKVEFTQSHDRKLDQHKLELCLPARRPDKRISVVVLETAGKANVDGTPCQREDGSVDLPAHLAVLHMPEMSQQMSIGRNGAVQGWTATDNSMSWDFKVTTPGMFDVQVFTAVAGHATPWVGGHKVEASVAGQSLSGVISGERTNDSPRAQYFAERGSSIGAVNISSPGTACLTLRAVEINKDATGGLAVCSVRLVPTE